MTKQELDVRYREANWLIAKRSSVAAAKALLIGSESLKSVLEKIAAIYGLTEEEQRKLRPTIASDVQSGVNTAVNMGKAALGATVKADQATKAARNAYKYGRVGKTLVTLVKAGPRAAQTVANTGRVAGKANPVIALVSLGYAAGTTGWLLYHARRFNRDAYEYIIDRDKLA